MLAGVKKSGVELQHEARKIRAIKKLQTAKYLVDANVFLEVELDQKKLMIAKECSENFISENWRV